MMSCGNVSSTNNSVEIMASLLKKLGNTVDDQISHQLDTLSENDKIFRSNLVSPNNQELVTRAVSDKTTDVFKFPNQILQRNPSHSSQISANQQTPSEIITPNAMISPRNFNFGTGITSPKDITSAILSPKGLRTFVTSPQNKTSPRKIVSDKGEITERKEIQPLAVINEKSEQNSHRSQTNSSHQNQIHQPELPRTPSFQEKGQDAVNTDSKMKEHEVKKGGKYGSLTINTEIVNQSEKRIESSKASNLNIPTEIPVKKINNEQDTNYLIHHSQSLKLDNNENNNLKMINEAQKIKRSSLADDLNSNSTKNGNLIKVVESIHENKQKESQQKIQSPPQVFQFGFIRPHSSQLNSENPGTLIDQTLPKKINEPISTIRSPKAEDKLLSQQKAPSPQVLGNKETLVSPPKNIESNGSTFSSYQSNLAFTFAPQQEVVYQKENLGSNKIEESKSSVSLKPKNKLEIFKIIKVKLNFDMKCFNTV